jgi:uncharacterized membrane protein YesL
LAKIFSVDSKAMQFLSRVWDLFLLNLLFIIGSLPVVTFGVSAIAAYTITLKMVEDREEGIVLAYFRAYKANLRQGLILTIAFIVFTAAVVADFVLFEIVEDNPVGFLIIGIICAILVFVHFFYVWALVARYHNSLYRHLTNSRNIFFRFFGRSLLCIIIVAFEIWLFFMNSWMLLFIGVFIAPILIIATISFFAMKIFHMLEAENDSREEAANEGEPDEKNAGNEDGGAGTS